ncbi:hypothetical protein VP1G_06276 [Cytospora mali]|uniref:5'-3' DNA helicase ZGRF1-like N-terminal domain-containing protein n=1 Tax=Cytospora mali TaxID=578113 RepID=A0A194V512_CYTMA|nr:hypothetical protein VP1G_06276 [Valsa mali var. pyri (nom. inval.)]
MSTSPPSAAAVLEYMCLFTHDLRRKQKRWQDGRLKYHTFNKRVMVYDERGNFVGDMHWHHDYDFDEGEEVELDRGGVIVQVSGLVARRETDLTELLDKRVKEKEQRQIQHIARSPAPTSVLPRSRPRPSVIPPDHFQLRHRPLHQVIGTPTGHHGKALVPSESPFEQRQQAQAAAAAAAAAPDLSDERAAKRRKHDDAPPSKSGYATALFGQSLTLSATPASSVPTSRRPRPELNSDPSRKADYPSAKEDAVPIQREKPKVSHHLNQKTGYAQGLFGQSLTLSHTPVSSVPSRRQPRHKSGSNSTLDVDTWEDQSDLQPALREQPKASYHYNQPASKQQTIAQKTEASLSRKRPAASNELAEGHITPGVVKEISNVPRDHRVREAKHAAPVDDGVIVIDDPGPVDQTVRHPRKEKGTPKDRSNVAAPRQKSSRGKAASNRPAEQENDQGSESEGRGRPGQSKRARLITSKPATKETTTTHSASEINQDVLPSFGTLRRPDEHVTELRLKSRKRGLLMISDAPKKPRRQVIGNLNKSSEVTEDLQTTDGADLNGLFRSPSAKHAAIHHREHVPGNSPLSIDRASEDGMSGNPFNLHMANGDDEWEDEEPRKGTRRTRAARTISTELGEINDHTQLSPAHQDSDREIPLEDDGVILGEDAVSDQATTHPDRVYDPYRIPSSPEEEVPFSWPASSPRAKLPPTIGSSNKGPDDVLAARKAGHKSNTVTEIKKQRTFRRKLVLEDDEEADMAPGVPDPTLVTLDDTEDSAPETNKTAPTEQSKTKRTAAISKRKSGVHHDLTDLDSDDGVSVKTTKLIAKKQHNEAYPESQDEQVGKRRRSTRQSRNRVDELEVSSLASEQDVSDEEVGPKKRQCRAVKASENRPRLERIKKNIKSRELIGFNLAALNAPLGPRGVGMPFGILPSPINESMQRRTSNEAAMHLSSDPLAEDGDMKTLPVDSGRQSTNSGPDRIVIDESLSPVLSSGTATTPPGPLAVNTRVVKPATTNKEHFGVIGNASADSTSNKERDGSTRIPGAPPRENSTGMIPSLDNPIVIDQIVNDCDPRHSQTKADISHAAINKDSALSNVSVDKSEAQKSTPARRRQQSKAAGDTAPEMKASQFAPITTETAKTISPPAIAATISSTSLQAPMINLQQRLSTGEGADDTDAEVERSNAGTTGSTTGSDEAAIVEAQVPLDATEQVPTSATRQQPSTAAKEDDGQAQVERGQPDAVYGIQVERIAGPAAGSRMTAPFKKPIPVMRRQPSATTVANNAHAVPIEEGPDSAGNDRNIPTCASAAPSITDAPQQKPTVTPVRPSSNEEDNTKGESDTSGEKLETRQAPAGPILRHKAIGLRRQITAPRRVNNIGTAQTLAGASETQTAESTAKAAARIVNPASRGRKAALASDAVGQVPQRVLPPTQPALLVPISTADLACTPYEPPPKEPERPKKKMTFPGFQSARGEGPWSREAFDLLESGRPG